MRASLIPDIYLVRHGETAWALSGQHTGLTDIPLTPHGEDQARRLIDRLRPISFATVLTSPLQRASRTCELAGYGSAAEVDSDLVEWNYGDYEGLKRPAILAQRPNWIIFRDGCPNGESSEDVGRRADRVLSRIKKARGTALVFSSGHFLRVLVARWLGLEASNGRYFKFGTATLTVLGSDHNSRSEPIVRLLNESPGNEPQKGSEHSIQSTEPLEVRSVTEVSMNVSGLESIARALVSDGKGILAADETVGTITKRFEKLKIRSTPEIRRDYRELLCTAPGSAGFISGVILYDETIRQRSSDGEGFSDLLLKRGIIPGIKVDTGAKPLSGCEDETITEGLDGLRERLKEYRALGAQFAKWRAVIRITDRLPSPTCIEVNAHALGRYAALCQEQGIVPIVEPEVLMDGAHSIERCNEVTGNVLHAVFNALRDQKVSLEGMLLKPNMVVPGNSNPRQASVAEVAGTTLHCLLQHVPAAVPGIVFLSGGQSDQLATAHLNAIIGIAASKPWKISFSFGRALQDQALAAWLGSEDNRLTAHRALYHRAKCNGAAALGRYTVVMEEEYAGERTQDYSPDSHDD